ncbi:probable serine/threonine-protein kinase DDB_G0267686 isoform X2 [Drosophila busckii]|uniref:probable serine/threonine-protein kinase DDB_G0267686 isoform X2 n=1 Tax=Drosophila busckii TaxID=30019 RepID=UPI00083F41EB|nr:probable serine/threonine-protein kinase DDB_G0267686 isoform X2 [Drosophila busckii]
MSQNQSYFWQTTRHNVYLKRSAKWHMALALMVVLTFSTICAAELNQDADDNAVLDDIPKNMERDAIMDKATDLSGLQDKPTEASREGKTKGNFLDAFTASISVILLTELGDKTFFIAAIMAMRHPRLIVFGGAIAALALMTVLSCVFGLAANFIPTLYTYYISTALFLIFGLKMLYDGYKMKPTDAQEELEEVQSDLRKREDELIRKAARRFEDDTKRKNSNSDKEDDQVLIHGRSMNVLAGSGNSNGSEMQHRQRKPTSSNNNNNNNNNTTSNNSTNSKRNICDKTGNDVDYNESELVLNDGGRVVEMTTFHGSPSSIASSNQTEQTNCDSPHLNNQKASVDANPNEPRAPLAAHDSMNGLNGSIGEEVAAALDRDVNASLMHDPESGRRSKPQRRGATYFTMRILVQAFTMTFLAEWGDRSQLTTIILAASKDIYGVIVGGILGHCICTGLAVIGGRLVASKISVRTVTIVGGIVFIGFAAYAVLMPPNDLTTN